MNEGVANKQMGSEPEFEGLRMKGLGNGKGRRPELSAGLEGKREGVKVRREREATHTSKEMESMEGRGEDGVSSDDVVVAKGRWVGDEIEERDGIAERTSSCRGRWD